MKIEKITDDKLRVIFNLDDLNKKNIDVYSLIKNTDSSQKFFKLILRQARKEVGFETFDSKVLIETFISSDGFFILTFTKLSNNSQKAVMSGSKPQVKRKELNKINILSVYMFNDFNEIIDFCTYLNNLNNFNIKSINATLYEYKSKYFLVFKNIHLEEKIFLYLYIAISEFANAISYSPIFIGKLNEYGNIIFKGNILKNYLNVFKENM